MKGPYADISDVDDFHKGMRSSKESVGLLTGSVRGLSAAMRNMGIAVTAASAISGAAMLTLSRRAERVNAAFREVDTITNSLTSSQEKYGDIVSSLNTEFGLQENRVGVISGLYQSLSAGIEDSEEAQEAFLETAGQLATVGLVDLETSVDVLSTVINTYNMEAEDAADVSETLFRTVQLGKVTLDELAPVMGRIAALGSEMGIGIEELGASMAQLTRNGFEARIAATGLRAVIRGFMRPSEEMKSTLRDIAIEQDGLVDSLTAGNNQVSDLASNYRDALSALDEFEQAQKEARREQDELSLSIQRSRLAITAIEQDRIDQLDDATVAELARSNSVEELEEQIEEYQLSLNEARITESESRLEQEETEEQIHSLKQAFVDEVDAVGDLGDGIGELFMENEGLVDTLIELNDATDDADLGMDDLFQRTRGLQAALALVGEDGENFVEILQGFQDGSLDAEEAWTDLSEEVREEEFDGDIENFKELQDLDIEDLFEDMIGPQEELRNEMSKLGETVEEIGDIFTDDLVNQIENFVNWVDGIRERIEGMDDSTKESIAQFAILATSIGLVLGPLLLLGGQMALIATALGVGLIPFLAITTGLFAVFAGALSTAIKGGDGVDGLFQSMQGTFDTLIDFLRASVFYFNLLVTPKLIDFGNTLFSLFGNISSQLDDLVETGQGFRPVLIWMAEDMAAVIEAFDTFVSENEDAIADFFVDIISLGVGVIRFIRDLIVSIIQFGKSMKESIDAGEYDLILDQIIPPLRKFKDAVFIVIDALMELAQTNEFKFFLGMVGALVVSLVVVFAQFLGAVADVVHFLEPYLVPVLRVVVFAMGLFVGIVAGAVALIGVAIKTLRNFIEPWMILIPIIMAVAAAFGPFIAAITFAVIVVGLAVKAIVQFFSWLYDVLVGNSIIPDLVNSILEWFDIDLGAKAKNMVMSFVNGMLDKIDDVKDAAKVVAGAVKDYLGFGSAPDALGEDYNPKNYGENVGDSLTDGMEDSIPDVEGESSNIAEASVPDTEDVEYNASADYGGSGSNGRGTEGVAGQKEKTEVIVEEGAIKVGPFHGLADDEVVEKVDEEVDKSMEQLVEDLRAKGVGGE